MRLHLIDGNSYIYRAYHALPKMQRSDGQPINAVFGFTKMLWALRRSHGDATHIAVIMDGGRSGREQISPDYKGQRPATADALLSQFKLISQAATALAIPEVRVRGYEADDVIASYARRACQIGAETVIHSPDKDLVQVLISARVLLISPMTRERLTAEAAERKYGVRPDQFPCYQALVGDAADNIPGIHGIGPQVAVAILRQAIDLERAIALAETGALHGVPARLQQALAANAETARMSRRLALLNNRVPNLPPLATMAIRRPNPSQLRAFCTAMEFAQWGERACAELEGLAA